MGGGVGWVAGGERWVLMDGWHVEGKSGDAEVEGKGGG